MKWTVGLKISSGYVIALVMLIAIGVFSYGITSELITNTKMVDKTQIEMKLLDGIITQVTAAESSERGYVMTGKEEYLDPFNQSSIGIPNAFKELKAQFALNPNLLEQADALEALVTDKMKHLENIVSTRRASGEEAAKAIVQSGTGKETMDAITNAVSDLEQEMDALLAEREQAADASADMLLNVIRIGIPVSILLIIVAAVAIIQGITVPLKETTEIAERIANGDLTPKFAKSTRQDEIGGLFRAFEMMLGSLREITGEIIEGVNVIASASSEIMASTAQVASGAMETASAISETTSSVEEVKQSAQLASEKARVVSEATRATVQASENGLKSVEMSIVGMNKIQDQVESIAQSLVRLSEQSQAIGEIIASVNDLAEQSNLLAVNAAIEAAKAGEQGKGFAVVAQEVKVLAEQSKEATSQVRTILNDILKAINSAVMATEQGGKAVEAGVTQSREAGETIRQMAEGVGNTAQMGMQIAVSSQQQLAGMDQIAMAMESIRQASEQNVSGTKQVEYTVQNLHELGQRLKQTVERYKL